MSIGLQITVHGDKEVEKFFASLLQPNLDEMLDDIGALVVSQTQSRIADEKEDPSGTPWADWTDRYAQTRHGGHSLLQGDGTLLNSINHQVIGGAVEVGSNLVYAGHHQFGSKKGKTGRGSGVPARPFLGVSPDNRDEIEDLVNDFIRDLLAE